MSIEQFIDSAAVRLSETVPATDNPRFNTSLDLQELDDLRAAALTAGLHPEQADAMAAELGIGAGLLLSPKELDVLKGELIASGSDQDVPVVAKITSHCATPESAAADSNELTPDSETPGEEQEGEEEGYEDDFQLCDLNSVKVKDSALEDVSQGLLRSVVLAFCSNEEVDYYRTPDVVPMPLQSNRAGNHLLFQIGTDDFRVESLAELTLRKGDWLEVDPDNKLPYQHGDLVIAIMQCRLTILELRKDAERPIVLFLHEMRGGEPVSALEALIIGRVQEYRRQYRAPQTAMDRAVSRALDAATEVVRAKKGYSRDNTPLDFPWAFRTALVAEQSVEVGGAR